MGLLSELVVRFSADASNLTSAFQKIKSDTATVVASVKTAATAIKGLEGAADGDKIITKTDVARAKLAIIEGDIDKAKAKIKSLEGAADAGQAVTGLDAAQARLLILEERAQSARDKLKQLEADRKQSGSGLMSAFQGAASGITSFAGKISEVGSSFISKMREMGSSVLDFGSRVGLAAMGFKSIIDQTIGFGQALLMPNANMEQTRIGFTTLLGSAQKAGDYLGHLSQFAASTPFEFPQVADAAQKLIAMGTNAKDVIPILTDIGDAMSGLGRGASDVSDVVVIFGQMRAAGKTTAEDMMQLTDRGIPAWKYLAEAMHLTIPEVQKLSSQGLIPADKAITALRQGMHDTFGGGMAAQSQSFLGLLSTLKDNVEGAWRAFSGPLFDAAKAGLTVLGNLVSSKQFQDFAQGTGKQIAVIFQQIGGFISSSVIPAAQLAGQMFVGMGNSWKEFFAEADTSGLSKGLQDLRLALAGLAPLWSLFLVLLNNVNNLIISVAGFLLSLAGPALSMLAQRIGAVTQVAQALIVGFSGIMVAASRFIDVVGPLIVSFVTWLANSGLLGAGMNILAGIITFVAGTISGLINIITSIISFFQQNQVAADLLVGVLIALAGAFVGIQVAGLVSALSGLLPVIALLVTFGFPAMITGLGGMAAAAWAAILPLLPFILIGAAVALVIAGIVLAVQHWSEISKVLQTAWSAVVTFFQGVWQNIQGIFGGIGQWFQDRFKQAGDGAKSGWQNTSSFFGNLGQWFQDRFKEAGEGVKAGLKFVVDSFNAANLLLAQGLLWLYNHNYYVQALVDNTIAAFNLLKQWIITVWTAVSTFLQGTWTTIVSVATVVWNALSTAVMIAAGAVTAQVQAAASFLQLVWNTVASFLLTIWSAISSTAISIWTSISTSITMQIQAMVAVLQSIWSMASAWLQAQWSLLAGFASAAWAAVSAVFGGIWNTYIAGPLQSLWNQFVNWFNQLGTQAQQSGTNFINMLANSIKSGAGTIWNAVVGIAQQIWKALGFHSPTEAGPGSDADRWMPNLINMLAGGLIAGQGQMFNAVKTVAAPLTMLNAPASIPTRPATMAAVAMASQPQQNSSTFIISLDGREIANSTLQHMPGIVRLKTGMRGL